MAKAEKQPNREIPDGGALIARLSANEFLVTGYRARVSFGSAKSERFMLARVEEGHFENGQWVFDRAVERRPDRLRPEPDDPAAGAEGQAGHVLGSNFHPSAIFPAKAGTQIHPKPPVGFTWAPAFAGETEWGWRP
jgi:hypothetical protein